MILNVQYATVDLMLCYWLQRWEQTPRHQIEIRAYFQLFPIVQVTRFKPCISSEQCTFWHHSIHDFVLNQLKHRKLCFVCFCFVSMTPFHVQTAQGFVLLYGSSSSQVRSITILGRQFRAPLGRSLGPYSIPLTQQKLEFGSNGSYCVAMYSIVLLRKGYRIGAQWTP